MLSNLSNNNAGNTTKSVVEKKKYEDIEKRLDEMQDEIEMTEEGVSTNSQAIASLDGRVEAVENNSTFPELNTDTINPATGDKVEITSDLDVDGEVEASSVKTNSLSVNGTNFTTVKDNAAQAKSTAESAKDKADEAYDLADAVADELADYKADNEQSITTGTLNADSVVTDSIAAQTINTNDFETTNAEIDKLYVDTIKATGFLELPTSGQQYYTITIPAKTTASFSGVYTSDNNTDYPYYFTVSDGAVIYKQGSTEIIKDISFDRETGYTKVRVKSSTNLTYISSALDSNPVTIEDGGEAYADYAFIPQKTGGYLIRGYDDTTTEIYIAGVLRAYAMSVEEEIIERTSVDFLKVNASIELPKDWDAGGTISYSTGEENQYISAQKKAGVVKPTWTSPIHSTIGSLSYSSKLVDEATVASYKGISETRQTQTISITNEASLQQLTAFHWTKNGTYWQPYETTRITIGDNTMWIDPTEANQGIRFNNNQVIADGTWDDVPVEEANAVPVNLVIFDAPTELSFPITNLGDKTTVHGEITATCFKGNVLGNVTGNADTATNATCFSDKTYAEAKADILSGCAADSNMFNGKTYSEAKADILTGNAASATNATCFSGKTYAEAKTDILSGCAANANDATCFDGHTYADAKADILSGNAASATNATCFDGCTYAQAKTDILSGNAASATNATCFNGCTYQQAKTDILSGCAANADNATCFDSKTYTEAKTDILSGTAAQAHCVDIDSLTSNSYPLVMESTTCELGKSGTCPITFAPSTGILETEQVSTSCIENSGTIQSQCLCATCDLNVDGDAFITGDLTVQGTITTTHSEEVVTPSENIILRDGATTPIASGCYSGFTVTNYDGQDNNLEVGADKDGTLHVGVVGGTMEPVATRACEACMEDGYAAHWDSTGTDLVTKGATSTHNLTVNGNASVTGNLSVTGTLTADLNGTAKNATCFGGCTYSQAKTDILSGNAASATNSTCFGGCTYACAKADILSGNAASATNATCFNGCTYAQAKADILSGCAADSAKLGNKIPSCYLDTSDVAQTKASGLNLGAWHVCSPTCAGAEGIHLSSAGVIELYKDECPYVDFHYNKYCGDYSARIANPDKALELVVTNGKGCTPANQTSTYKFCSDGTFFGATNICGSNIYQNGNKVIDSSSTAQTKAGNLKIGAPAACTTTSEGGSGVLVGAYGALQIFQDTPTIDLRYHKYCGEYSARLGNTAKGRFHIGVNDGEGCCGCSQSAIYCFNSDGTFKGACTICASTNIYSEGCPVVTTGTLPTVAPGYNCTGTSNYVVTTMVCCAKSVCRNQATTGTCHLALFDGKTAVANADAYVSNGCELTYEPSTGVLNVQKVCQCTDSYHAQLQSPNNTTKYITLKLGNANRYIEFTSTVDIDVYNNHVHLSVKVSAGGVVTLNEISRTVDYGIRQYLLGAYDDTNKTITIYFTFTNYREANIVSSTPIVEASASTTAPTGTFIDIPFANRTSYINTSSSNEEYPLVFSTCCATPAAGNRTLYNDSANNLMYNPSTNTLTACCVKGTTNIRAGNPTSCTSTRVGSNGIEVDSGSLELYHATPFVDFHVNNTCADYSHRIIANNGYLRVTATNATGCTAATQTANFDFCSNGTLKATCFDGNATCFGGCTYAQAKTDILSGNAASATNATCFGGCTYAQAKADILSGTATTSEYTCINDVNSGAQNILMTSSTGTLGIVNASTGTNACPLTFNPATGELATSCVKVGNSIIKGCYTNTTPVTMCISHRCLSVTTSTTNLLDVMPAHLAIGVDSCAELGLYGPIAIGGLAHACNDSIVIGSNSCGSQFMTVIGNNLHLDTGDSEKHCINAIVMSPYSGYIDDPTHLFGCARIMVKYGTKQCTMYKFLNCLFSGRTHTGAYAYAERIVQGDCCNHITGWDDMSYYALCRCTANSFCLANHWTACETCEAVISAVCCTDGYTSFDLVW